MRKKVVSALRGDELSCFCRRGLGERTPANMVATLAARDRNLAGPTAPPTGLCLTEVRYHSVA